MHKRWLVGAPQMQARLDPSDDGTQRLTVTIEITISSTDEASPPGGPVSGPVRLPLPRWPDTVDVVEVVDALVLVPSVIGSDAGAATAALQAAGLTPVDNPFVSSGGVPYVTAQNPPGGTWVSPGSDVTLDYVEQLSEPKAPWTVIDIDTPDPVDKPDPVVLQLEFGPEA